MAAPGRGSCRTVSPRCCCKQVLCRRCSQGTLWTWTNRVACRCAAGRSHSGCVTTRMLLAAGVSEDRTASLVRRGALTRVARSVYVVGQEKIAHHQLLQAALLLANSGAHLTGRSAAEAHHLLSTRAGTVSVARTAGRGRATRRVRTELVVAETGRVGWITLVTIPARHAEWETVDGFAAESPARALRRMAAAGDDLLLRRAWREAEFQGVLLEAAIEAEIRSG